MVNQWLCYLFLLSTGVIFGFALDSMEQVKETAPPKWVRVGLWVVVTVISGFYQVFVRDSQQQAANMLYWGLGFSAAVLGGRCFYGGNLWNKVAVYLVLVIANLSAELSAALGMILFRIPKPSTNYARMDMVFYVLVGSVVANTMMYFAVVLWRRWKLQRRMPRGSWAFVVMPLCLVVPTTMYGVGVYQRGDALSALHVASMAGALLLDLLLICVQFNQAEKDQVERELTQLRHQAQLERQYYQSVEQRREEMAKIRHDYNNLLSSVLGLLHMDRTQEAEEMVLGLLARVEATREAPYCGIPIVNAILSEKEGECTRKGVSLETDLLFPEDVGVSPIGLCSLFSNLLDNAIRACTQLPPEQSRRIRLTVGMQGDYMLVRCDNPATKGPGAHPEGSGYGMKILQDIAQRHGGTFSTQFEGGIFTARLVLLADPKAAMAVTN